MAQQSEGKKHWQAFTSSLRPRTKRKVRSSRRPRSDLEIATKGKETRGKTVKTRKK